MKALSIIQPWASLIAIGAKRIETRSWPTNHRGWIAIHASKKYPANNRALELAPPFREALSPYGLCLPTGVIIAVAKIIDCIPTEEVLKGKGIRCEHELAFGNYTSGRYGWLLSDIRALKEPIPCKGALSLWTVLGEIERRICVEVG